MNENFNEQDAMLKDMISKIDIVVLFYADWCPHCVRFKPVWNKVIQKLKTLDDKIMPFSIPDTKLPTQISIDKGYPTLMVFKKGSNYPQDGIEFQRGSDENETMDNILEALGRTTENQSGGKFDEDSLYRSKYIKYKQKYFQLKYGVELSNKMTGGYINNLSNKQKYNKYKSKYLNFKNN